jgi:hypothetical protein
MSLIHPNTAIKKYSIEFDNRDAAIEAEFIPICHRIEILPSTKYMLWT